MCALNEDIRYMHPNCSQIACCIFFSCLSLPCITRRPLQLHIPSFPGSHSCSLHIHASTTGHCPTHHLQHAGRNKHTQRAQIFQVFRLNISEDNETCHPLHGYVCSRCYTMMKKSLKVQNVKMIKNTSQRSV